MNRVVVTGMSGICPIGQDWETVQKNLSQGQTGIHTMTEWEIYPDLLTRLAGPVADFSKPAHYSRKQVRSMGRVALMATVVTERALADAGLLNDPLIQDGRMGVSYGSSSGSTDAIADFGNMLLNKKSGGLNATSYLQQ